MKWWLIAAVALSVASTGCEKIKSMASGASAAAGSLFGTDFEGDITMAASGRGHPIGPTSIVIEVKRPRFRIDANTSAGGNSPLLPQSSSILIDPPQKKAYALVPAQKKAIVLDLAQAQNLMPGGGSSGAAPKEPTAPAGGKVEKTGKKDVVAGYACEIWKVTQASGASAELCMAEGITWIDLGDLGWSSPDITLAAVANGTNRFPLRIVSFDANGAEESRLEAKKIEKKKLDDARFQVPPDYQVIDVASMMKNIPLFGGPPK